MTKFNDGQLDEANRRIAELERSCGVLSGVCARRLSLLMQVASSPVQEKDLFYVFATIKADVWREIIAETDENEVSV